MSKLEDKLTASLKPDQGRSANKAAPRKPDARRAPPQATEKPGRPDLNKPDFPLHPDRVWPD